MFKMVFIPLNYLCVVRWVQICGIIPLFNVMTSLSPWHYRTLSMIQLLKCIKTLNLWVNALIFILIVVQCATKRTHIPNWRHSKCLWIVYAIFQTIKKIRSSRWFHCGTTRNKAPDGIESPKIKFIITGLWMPCSRPTN